MAGSPTNALIGVAGIGFGIVLVYAAIRNVPVFGKDGIVTYALTKGQIPDVSTLPPLFNVNTGVLRPLPNKQPSSTTPTTPGSTGKVYNV